MSSVSGHVGRHYSIRCLSCHRWTMNLRAFLFRKEISGYLGGVLLYSRSKIVMLREHGATD